MNRLLPSLAAPALALLLGACASTKIPRESASESDPQAQALVAAAQRAHGGAMFGTVHDLSGRSAGKWGALAPRFQPVLLDRRYGRESEDAIDLYAQTIVQLQTGRGGRKFVARGSERIAVWYNGQPDERDDVRRAAALVADAAKMLLLGPFYFQRPGVTLTVLGTGKVDRIECDEVLAVLRPGFGFADEDRVILSLDRQTNRLRRVRMTLNGTAKTQGVETDVTFRDWTQRGGVLWAMDYEQRLLSPFSMQAHRWRLLELKLNHGIAPRAPELLGEALSEAGRRAR